MPLNTVIFDMDGLLIDSEPLWEAAGTEALQRYGVRLTDNQYHSTTGLRTREWLQWWFGQFNIDAAHLQEAEEFIIARAIEKIGLHGEPFAGVEYIFSFFRQRGFRIGLATSSPLSLVQVVIQKLQLGNELDAIASAEKLSLGKPHPQVYLDCALLLHAVPHECVCFEDSFNGMIAAKAARMKCVVIPARDHAHEPKWKAADLQLDDLGEFNEEMLGRLNK